jgi:hypothetical protein
MEFIKETNHTIMDGEVIRWTGQVDWNNKPEISASHNGVLISGDWPVMKQDSINQVIKVFNIALAEHDKLKFKRY